MINLATGEPFRDDRDPRVHLHHSAPPSECASLGGGLGRARGLLGGCFMGTMMASKTRGVSARSYVQGGMIAQWDGIENIGYGEHSPSSSRVKNLITNEYFTLASGNSVGDDYVSINNTQNLQFVYDEDGTHPITVEMCRTYTYDNGSMNFGNIVCGIFGVVQSRRHLSLSGCNFYAFRNPSDGRIHYYGDGVAPVAGMAITATFTGAAVGSSVNDNACYVCGAIRDMYTMSYTYEYSGGYRYGNASITMVPSVLRMNVHSIRIYSRVLTAAEVEANYAVDKARFNLPD